MNERPLTVLGVPTNGHIGATNPGYLAVSAEPCQGLSVAEPKTDGAGRPLFSWVEQRFSGDGR